jgi:large subunit ribosomal protein L15
MKLNELKDNDGARSPRKRLGRGIGSGLGKTSGKGHKGAKARTSNIKPRYFEGGQMPIYRRLPKRGFKNPTRQTYSVINLDSLQKAVEAGKFAAGATVDAEAMLKAGLIGKLEAGVRLLARGELTTPLTIEVVGASKAAIAAVGKAGGAVVIGGVPAAADAPAE